MTVLRAYRVVTIMGVFVAYAGPLAVYFTRGNQTLMVAMLVLALLSVVSMGIVHLGLHRAVIGAAEIPRLSGDVQTVEFDGTPMRIDTVKVSLERAHGVTACFADGIGPRTEVTLHLTELTPYTTNSPKQGNSDQH